MIGKARKAGRALRLATIGVMAVARLSRRWGKAQGRREAEHGGPPRFVVFLAGTGAGAAAEYLLTNRDRGRASA